MPDRIESPILPGPRTRATEGVEYRKVLVDPPDRAPKHVSRDEARSLVWLPWRSNGCEHGDKPHKFNRESGVIEERGDRAPTNRKKSKAVSSRQWERRE